MIKRLKLALRRFFYKDLCYKPFSFGEMDKDRFCTVLQDGKETNCRMYMWDAEEVKRLQAIGDEIHRQKGLTSN